MIARRSNQKRIRGYLSPEFSFSSNSFSLESWLGSWYCSEYLVVPTTSTLARCRLWVSCQVGKLTAPLPAAGVAGSARVHTLAPELAPGQQLQVEMPPSPQCPAPACA